MKDLLVFLASRCQEFLPLIFRIVAHPRINILTLAQRPKPVADAMVFFAMCSAIGMVLQATFLMERNEFIVAAGILSVYKVIEFAVAALALVLVFRMLRGTGGFEPTLAATLYIICPLYIWSVMLNLLMTGVLKGIDPALAMEWRHSKEFSEATIEAMWAIDWRRTMAVTLIFFVEFATVFGWLIVCWPVYSRLNGFGRWRSIASFVLALLALWLVGEIGLIIVDGIFPDGLGGAY